MKKIILILLVISQFLFTYSLASIIPKTLTESNGKAAYTLDCSGMEKIGVIVFRKQRTFALMGLVILKNP